MNEQEYENFSIDRFTSSTATLFLNTVAESLIQKQTQEVALAKIFQAFNNFVETVERKNINVDDIGNHNAFIDKAAKLWVEVLNTEDVSWETIVQTYRQLVNKAKEEGLISIKLSADELSNLGFSCWSESNQLMLIPIWAYELLPKGITLISINGDSAEIFSESISIQNERDLRHGHLGWGFYVRETV